MVLDVDIAAFGLVVLSSTNHNVARSGLGDKVDVKADGVRGRIRRWWSDVRDGASVWGLYAGGVWESERQVSC
jgi:hypothetical protein